MDTSFLAQIVFYVFAAITMGSAFVVVFSRSLIHSAFALLFTFFGVAVLYVFLGADFLAATQMVIYVGGILVLILFGVMLTHKLYDLKLRSAAHQFYPGIAVGAAVFTTLGWVISQTTWHDGVQRASEPTTADIGTLFMTDFILPFEVASVFLLVALIGAAMIVRRRTR